MKKRILAMLLVVAMVLTYVPSYAFAAESDNSNVVVTSEEALSAPAEGSEQTADGSDEPAKVAYIGEQGYDSLQAAVDAVAEGETIVLTSDITFTTGANGTTNGISVTRGVNFDIDLNGKTVTSNLGGNALRFKIGEGNDVVNTKVTIKIFNGKVVSGSSNWCAISGSSADNTGNLLILNLEDLEVENSKSGDYAIKSWAGAKINAENVTVTSSYGGSFYAVGGEMVLDNCTAVQTGLHTEPYMSMAVAVSGGGKMTINSGSYSATPAAAADGSNQGSSHGSWAAGVMNSGGTLIINGGTFANGNYGEDSLATAARGIVFVDTYATLEINDGTFNALKGIVDYQNNLGVSAGNPVVTVKGGTYSANPEGSYVKVAEGYKLVEKSGTYTVSQIVKAATIGEESFETLKEAFAAVKDGETIVIQPGEYSEGTIKLRAAMSNVTVKGSDNHTAILKDMVITSSDGNTVSYSGLTFDGIVFENSRLLFTGQRSGKVLYEDFTVNNCIFKNIVNDGNLAAVHFNTGNAEVVTNFTFTNNVIDNLSGSSMSGVHLQCVGGEINISNNVLKNIVARSFHAQVQNGDGIADSIVMNGNTITGSPEARTHVLGKSTTGTDTVTIEYKNNIHEGITTTYVVCFYNFNGEATELDASENYYDIDVLADPTRFYYNSKCQTVADLEAMGVFPYYTKLNEDGTIDLTSKVEAPFDPAAMIGETPYRTVAEAFAAAVDGDEIIICESGTYALGCSGKDITITASVGGVEFTNIGAYGMNGANVTFNNVDFTYGNDNYKGLQHAGNLVYNNCFIRGQVFLYGASETFKNCTFDQTSSDAYNVWTYGAKEVEFNNCKFYCEGKSVLIYAESESIFNDVTFNYCELFANSQVEGKAAIEMDSSLTSGINLTISNTTAEYFADGNVSGNSLWNNKKGSAGANNDITVTVDGEVVLAPYYPAFIGEQGYDSLQAAVEAAVQMDAENVTIEIVDGTHAADLNITNAAVTVGNASKRPNITFKPAEGAEVILAGTVTVGYREQNVAASTWNGEVTFENITFQHAESGKHSLSIQDVAGFALTNCTVIGDGEYGIGTPSGNNTTKIQFTDCTFENGAMQVSGLIGANLVVDGCTMNDFNFNVQGGAAPGMTIQNSTFNMTLTDAHVGESFYVVRTNAMPVNLINVTVNVDSEASEIAADQAKWAIFWARKDSNAKWTLKDVKVNLTEAAMAQTELLLCMNSDASDTNGIERIEFTNLTSASNDVADLIERSTGYMVVHAGTVTYLYKDGQLVSKSDTSVAYIGNVGYESFEAALNAVEDGQTITLTEGAVGDEMGKDIEFTKAISFTITGKAPEYKLPVITFKNATVTIEDAEILIPELDARQNATINVVNSIVEDCGGDSIVKSYYNGAINISGTSVVYTMQVTTMGYITVSDSAVLNATWQTNVYGNGLITVEGDATFATAALQLTGKDYSGRDNTDADRVGQPAAVVVDGATLIVGSVKASNGADYSYNSSKGVNIGTIEGKAAVLEAKNDATVNIYMANGETAKVGADGQINLNDAAFNVVCRSENGTVNFVNEGTVALGFGSELTAPSITGAGEIAIDGAKLVPGPAPVYADASAFTGTIEVINSYMTAAVIDGQIMLEGAELVVVTMPEDVTVHAGEVATFTAEAQGDGLTYQWFYQDAKSEGFVMNEAVTGNVYTVDTLREDNGFQVYCVISDAYGNVVISEVATLTVEYTEVQILTQPTDASAVDGAVVKSSVVAEGDGLTYQWYIKTPGSSKFYISSVTSATYACKMNAANDGRQVYCRITDAYDNYVDTEVVTLTMKTTVKITEQPADVSAFKGETVELSVEATGDGLTYAWFVKTADQTEFVQDEAATGNTYTTEILNAQVYCVVTDAYGNSEKSETVTLTLKTAVKILTQPTDASAVDGAVVKSSVVAEGDGLTYQWYIKTPGSSKFYISSVTSATYACKMNAANDGRQVYCRITDAYDNYVDTEVVTLTMKTTVKITKQPISVAAAEGEQVTVTVEAVGDGLTYEWYYKNTSGKKFTLTTAFTGNTYSVAMSNARDGRQLYCIVTDAYGNSMKTDTVTITMTK